MIKTNMKIFTPVLIYYLFCVVFLAHFGFSLNDPGYLYGMGYRILLGQNIYTDFIYARPPLSPYLAAFWMYILPETGQYYYTKIVLYSYELMMAIMIYFVLKRHMEKFFKSANNGVMLLLVYAFNINYFNHFWHTSDGLLFATIAVFIGFTKLEPSNKRIGLLAFFTILAMATKQSYYPFPFAVAIALWFMYSKNVAIKYIANIVLMIIVVLTASYLFAHDELIAYMGLKQKYSQVAPFIQSGISVYIMPSLTMMTIFSIVIGLIKPKRIINLIKRKKYNLLYKTFVVYYTMAYVILFATLTLETIKLFLQEGDKGTYFDSLLQAAVLLEFLWIIIEFWRKKLTHEEYRAYALVFVLIALSWCSSLSWGKMSPIMYSSILVIFPIYIFWKNTHRQISNWILYWLALSFIASSTIIILQGARMPARDLKEFSKVLEGTYLMNKSIYEHMKTIDTKVKQCGNKTYTVIPSNPHIHWIYGDKPQTSLDWISNVEMMNKMDKIKKELSAVECIVVDENYSLKGDKRFDFNRTEMLTFHN